MKIINIQDDALTVELDPTDCIALADACAWALRKDIPGDWHLLSALEAVLTAGGMAAFSLNRGMEEPENYTLAKLREIWAPFDHHAAPLVRVLELEKR